MRIFVAGHRGMVGSAVARALALDGTHEVITVPRDRLDLTDQRAVAHFFACEPIDAVILAAARVGGIMANAKAPASFLYDNLAIAANVIHAAHEADINRLIQLGSSCIYPRDAAQPIREEALMTGALEPTNAPYALAKITAIKLCESYNIQYGRDYRSLMPTNLYGPGDNFHPEKAHVIPALIQRFDAAVRNGARHVTLWGTGTPRREFLHVDDLAAAVMFIIGMSAEDYARQTDPDCSHINVGTGKDISILALARTIARLTGFEGVILTDPEKPDGTPRKCLDISRMTSMGWRASKDFEEGLAQTVLWYRQMQARGARLRAS